MRSAAVLLAYALLALGGSIDAFAATSSPAASDAFAAGSREFGSGEWSRALEHFLRARDAGMQGPAVWYNIGVCQYRLGHYESAATTFRSMIEGFPAMAPLAEYNLGLALARQERFRQAEAAFQRATTTGDPTVAGLAGAMLDRIAPRLAMRSDPWTGHPSPGQWRGFLDLSGGYDDNVALRDDAGLSSGESPGSAFGQFYGQLGRVSSSEGGWGAAVSAWMVRYPDAERFDQNVLRLGGSWRWRHANWRFDAGPYYSYSTLDGEGFEQRLGAATTMTRPFDTQTTFSARLALEDVRELESQFAFVSGSRQLLQLRLKRRTGQGRFELEYEFTRDDRAAASVAPTRHEFAAGYRHWIGNLWSFGATASYRSSRYDDLSVPRSEDRSELALVLTRNLSAGWQLTGTCRLSSNDSSIDGFSYNRSRLQIGVNRVFQ